MIVTQTIVQPTGVGWPDYITAISDPSSIAQAVHFDSVNGVTGTNYPVGTAGVPVNNETDLRAICTNRGIRKVVLRNAATILKFTSALVGIDFIGEGVGGLTPIVDFNGQAIGCTFNNLRITDTTGSNLVSVSEFVSCGILTVIAHTVGGSNYYRCRFSNGISNPPLGRINCYDDCIFIGDFHNTSGFITVTGNCIGTGNLTNTTGGIFILGNCQLYGSITNTTGDIYIYGNCNLFFIANTTGFISIYGSCQLVQDVTNTTGNILIMGNCGVGDAVANTTGTIEVRGNILVVGNIVNTTGHIVIRGDCVLSGNLTNEHFFGFGTIKLLAPNPTIDMSLGATSTIQRIVSRGSLTVAKMVAGATAIIDLCGGTLTILVSCTGGVIDLYGDCALVNAGATTVNDYRIPGHS